MFENVRDLAVQLMPVVGIALIIAALVMRMRRRRQGMQAQGTAREQLDRLRQERGLRGDLDRLMVEIEQMAKRLGAQLDAKTIQLERLLDQADARLAELREREAGGASGGQGRSDPPAPGEASAAPPPHGSAPTPTPGAHTPWGVAPPVPPGSAAAAPGVPGGRAPGSPESDPDAPDPDAGDPDALTRRVYALADRGEAPDAIARQLDEHIGKIELMLALRQA